MKYLVNPANRRFAIPADVSANKLATTIGIQGNIGKTAILELMRGVKVESKGWRIIEASEMPKRANKSNFEYVGTSSIRKRKPMLIHIVPKYDVGLTGYHSGDMLKFLELVYKQAKASEQGKIEYSEVGKALGWSRNIVSVYAAAARDKGFIEIERQSNKVHNRKKQA